MPVIVRIFVQHHHRMLRLSQNEHLARILFLVFAQETARFPGGFVDVDHPPWRPELLHDSVIPSASSTGFPSTLRRSSLPTLKNGTRLAATETRAPLFGLRPWRARRCLTTKLPKPRISMRSPCASASTIESKIALIITSESRRDRCGKRLFTSSMRSLFVMSFSPKREVVLVVQPFGRVEERVPSSFP